MSVLIETGEAVKMVEGVLVKTEVCLLGY
jgi:hypothetical protein